MFPVQNSFIINFVLQYLHELLIFHTGIMEGNAQVIFLTPEKAVDSTWIRRLTMHYKDQCVAVAFDEAHCISEW